jgi:hypothetical protein
MASPHGGVKMPTQVLHPDPRAKVPVHRRQDTAEIRRMHQRNIPELRELYDASWRSFQENVERPVVTQRREKKYTFA